MHRDPSSPPTLQFLGAAGTVTGSKHLLTTARARVLLDCGLFQGLKELRLRNWAPLPFDPSSVDAVVLSHAHLDHSGGLPLLVRAGFRGPIHCTAGTRDLLRILLADAAHLQEEEAAFANRHGYSKHHPAQPLFTAVDVAPVLEAVQVHAYGETFDVAPAIRASFGRSGHILGSAISALRIDGPAPLRLVYTGDLGRWDQPILRDPEGVPGADVLLIESTYGDSEHRGDPVESLATIVRETAAEERVLLIPSFAVGRTQTLIWVLRQLEESGRIPRIPVVIDSPMANRVSEVYCEHLEDLDREMREAMDHKKCPLCCKRYELSVTREDSKSLNARTGPMVIIAGSGMATGGRILHHFEQRLSMPRTTVLLVGFQAAGTRGRALQDGAKQLRMHGKWIPVAARVCTIHGLSAHADRNEMLRWLSSLQQPPRMTYLVHGESRPAQAMATLVETRLGWPTHVARDGESVILTDQGER